MRIETQIIKVRTKLVQNVIRIRYIMWYWDVRQSTFSVLSLFVFII